MSIGSIALHSYVQMYSEYVFINSGTYCTAVDQVPMGTEAKEAVMKDATPIDSINYQQQLKTDLGHS